MPEIKVDHVAEAEQYLLSLDTLTTADAYVAVAAAQAHSTLAQIATAYELADLQRQMLAALQPATPPAEAVEADEVARWAAMYSAAIDNGEQLARELRLDLQACHATLEAVALALREEADDIGANDPAADFLNKWADRIQPAAPEPTPEQVEAEPVCNCDYVARGGPGAPPSRPVRHHPKCDINLPADKRSDPRAEQVEADLAQDEQAHARYYAQPDVPVASRERVAEVLAAWLDSSDNAPVNFGTTAQLPAEYRALADEATAALAEAGVFRDEATVKAELAELIAVRSQELIGGTPGVIAAAIAREAVTS